MKKTQIGYMCMTDFDDELGGSYGGVEVYSSEKDLRDHKNCVDRCGIVKVTVSVDQVIKESNWYGEEK